MGRSEEGPGYPRHRDYSGIHHGGTDGLICVELGYPRMHVDRWPGQANGREVEVVVTPNDGELGRHPFISTESPRWVWDHQKKQPPLSQPPTKGGR